MLTHLTQYYMHLLRGLDDAGHYLAGLVLRLLLAWEFGEAGVEKWRGENWFTDVRDAFPFPFNVVPADLSWLLATWTELAGAALLVVGLATRAVSAALIVLTIVAWYAVHAGHGYNVGEGGWKLPLIYLVLLLPLLLHGPGRLSLDAWLLRRAAR